MRSVVCAIVLLGSSTTVLADNKWPFDTPPYLYIGAEYQMTTKRDVQVCNHGHDAANLGFGQTVYYSNGVQIDFRYTHHSCISEYRDKGTYDGIGFQAIVYLW